MSTRADPRTPRARTLRHEATPQERKLWARLKQVEWPGGGHFRRQVPIGPYYADFAHHGLKLVVELDGGQHSADDAVRRDAARTAYLESAGYRVLRFWNAEIADNFDGVIDTIYARAAERPPTPVRASRDSALPAASGGRVGAWVGLAFLASIVALSASPAHAFEQRQVGSWVLKWGQSKTGFYCTVETVQDGRTFGYQVIRDKGFVFGFRNPAWSWPIRSSREVRVSVPGAAGWRGNAVTALPDTLVLIVGQASGRDPGRVLETNPSMTLSVEGRSITYSLAGFAEAHRAQRACLERTA